MENEEDERGLCDNNAVKSQSNKHSYFLRAKAPRLMGFQVGDHEDRRASASTFLSRSREEEDLANCLVMLSNNKSSSSSEKGMFQCKACKKVFNSHQALGGHRASHKKVKGCFASKLDELDEDVENTNNEEDQAAMNMMIMPELAGTCRKRVKMHECSVCRRVFTSGQALGGHKRCHWLTTSTDNAFNIPNFQYHDHRHNQQILITKHDHHQLDLNLNLPPPQHDHNDHISKTSTKLCLHQWTNHSQHNINDKEVLNKNVENGSCGIKLRNLRDVNMDGSGWLQMGIAASNTTEMR
ncbi:hypothetical protein ACS0TY_001380 [Phlomoides rotata]